MPDLYHYLQQLINGLTVGSTYALIAIGYTMVYGIIGMINFAHGEVYMIGSYVVFIVIAGLAMFGLDSLPLMMIAGFAPIGLFASTGEDLAWPAVSSPVNLAALLGCVLAVAGAAAAATMPGRVALVARMPN